MTVLAESPVFVEEAAAPELVRTHEVIAALTGVRAVAAAWVVIGHFSHLTICLFPGMLMIEPLLSSCYLGVDLFFVLSGFILTHNYLSSFDTVTPGKYGRFLWARLARLYPVHIFTLMILLAGVLVGSQLNMRFNAPHNLTWSDFVHQIFLTHSWGWGRADSWNGPAWSISAEWFAYLLFPFIIVVLTRIRSPRLAWLGVFLSYIALYLFLGKLAPSYAPPFGNERPLVRVITEFIAGCCIYRVYQSGWGTHFRWSWIATGCVIALLAYIFYFPPQSDLSLVPAPILAMLILALARSQTGISALFATPLFVFWGEVSYALYMTHGVLAMILKKLFDVERHADANLLVKFGIVGAYAAIIAIFAIATYMLVERPARKWMRSLVPKPV